MNTIDKENTSLRKLGLTYDMMMQDGERIEFDPEGKTNRKEKYIRYAFANQIKDAYADDLEDAYHVIEALQKEVTDLKDENEEILASDKNKTSQLKKVLTSDGTFKEAEKLLAQLDQQMELFEKSKTQDKATIQKLKDALTIANDDLMAVREKAIASNADMDELEQLRNEIPKMRDEVQSIIDDFIASLKEAGIDIEDD